MNIIKDIVYDNNLNQKLDFAYPDIDGYTTIIYFHGGGIENGSKDNAGYLLINEEFVKYGYAVANVDYPLYPNTKFPEYIVECAKAVAFVKEYIKNTKANGKIVISGQSAGAYLSAMLMFDTHYLLDEGVDPMSIDGWIPESGQMTSHFNVIKFEDRLNPLCQRIDEKAVLYFIDQNTKFTKALFFYYDQDMPMRKKQNLLLEETVKTFNPDADIEMMELHGSHCYGSSNRDVDGELPYIRESVKWMKKKGL